MVLEHYNRILYDKSGPAVNQSIISRIYTKTSVNEDILYVIKITYLKPL